LDSKVGLIVEQIKRGGVGTFQAVDNLSAFTHPSNFSERMASLRSAIRAEYEGAASRADRRRILEFLLFAGLALKDSEDLALNLQNASRHGADALSDDAMEREAEATLDLLDELEAGDPTLGESILASEKERLEMIMAPRQGKGVSLLSAKAMDADTRSLRAWIEYWAAFGKGCNLRKLSRTIGMEGVDYGVGVFYARCLWGANLVMMNPSLAIFALEDDIQLNRSIDHMVFEFGDVASPEEFVRRGTAIAGLKARIALRAVWLLAGKGRISFQVQPSTYVTNEDLLEDVRSLMNRFDAEALAYDEELLLDEVMAPEEIEARKGRTHVFFKVDGSRPATYGKVQALTLAQLDGGAADLAEGDSEGLIEAMLSGWEERTTGRGVAANCNITVNGFVSDVLPGALCQFRGHAKARGKGIPISHSIITRMGGRVEGLGIRWFAMQAVVNGLREQGQGDRADEVAAKIGGEFDHAKNGALDLPEFRALAREAGFVLAEEVRPEEYAKHRGELFPTDDAIRITAEAITKRSHQILEALKGCVAMKKAGAEPWETLLLQASMRGPYKGRYPHVVEIVAPEDTVAQGHFPNAAKDVEEFEGFEADPTAIDRPVDPVLADQLACSVVGEEWAKAYEVSPAQAELLRTLGIYDPTWGDRGMAFEEFVTRPFPQQTLFGKVFPLDRIPRTKEENEAVEKGFVGDFNALGRTLLERNEREAYKRAQLAILADAVMDASTTGGTFERIGEGVAPALGTLDGPESGTYTFAFDTLVEANGEIHLLATNAQREIDPETFQATAFSPVEEIVTFYDPDAAPGGRQMLRAEERALLSTPKDRRIAVQIARLDSSAGRILLEDVLADAAIPGALVEAVGGRA